MVYDKKELEIAIGKWADRTERREPGNDTICEVVDYEGVISSFMDSEEFANLIFSFGDKK